MIETEFEASVDVQEVVEVLFEADQWMIFRNIFTDTLHWDFVSLFACCLHDGSAANVVMVGCFGKVHD